MKENTFKPKSLSLLVGLAGCAIAISPLPSPYKILSTATASVVCGVAAVEQTKNKKQAIASTAKERQNLDFERLQLDNDRHSLEQDLQAIAALRQEIELERSTLSQSLRFTEDSAIASLQQREEQTNAEIAKRLQGFNADMAATRKLAAARLRSLKARTWSHRRKMLINIVEQFDEEMTSVWNRAIGLQERSQARLDSIIQRITIEEKANADDAAEALKRLFGETQEKLVAIRLKGEADLADDLKEGQKILSHFSNVQAKKSEAKAQKLLEEGLMKAIAIVTELEIALMRADEEISKLQGELSAIAKPAFCPYENRHGQKANDFIRFVNESLNIKLVWLSSLMLSGDCLQLDFSFHESEDRLKAIAKLQKPQAIEAIAVRFGNEGIIIQANPVDHCWRATIPPNEGYQGSQDPYQLPTSREADEIESALRSQLDYIGTEAYMTNFVPVPINVETLTREVSQQELTTISFYMFWRSTCSNSPCIVSVPGLLKAVYGVSEEQGRAKDPRIGESLYSRLERLQPTLRHEYGDLILGKE